jgi:hypothetical protein
VKIISTNHDSITPQVVFQIGFWSALLTTVWILIFNVAIALGAAGAPTRSLAVGASLLLALSFVVLMSSIHSYAPPDKKVWSQIGLSFAILYAALLIWNYYLQLTVVRTNPLLYSWLTMDFTSETAFWSLESIGYALMGLAALFALPVLPAGRIERVLRWCFVVNAAFTILGTVGYVLSSNPLHVLVLASLGMWAIAFPIATALMAVMFRRAEKMRP